MICHFWEAAIEVNPNDSNLKQGERFPICQPEPLRNLFGSAGLHEIDVRAIDVPTHFHDFADYWSPFLGGQFPAPAYVMSLNEEDRAALRQGLRATLPISDEGTIRLIARAWAVRGKRDKL